MSAELRGPKTPFSIDKDGKPTFHPSTLHEQLIAAGYVVKDSRIDIAPEQIKLAPGK